MIFSFAKFIHPKNTLEEFTDVKLYDCCNEWADGNQWSKFDCASELIKADCESDATCDKKYLDSLEEYEAELALRATSTGNDDEIPITEEVWFIVVFYVTVPLLFCTLIALAVWGKKTNCGKQPCYKNKKSI